MRISLGAFDFCFTSGMAPYGDQHPRLELAFTEGEFFPPHYYGSLSVHFFIRSFLCLELGVGMRKLNVPRPKSEWAS